MNLQENRMEKTESTYHIPVLLHESIEGMHLQPGGTYVDVTFGGGGHSREILRNMDSKSRLFSFDQDADAERNIINDKRFTFVRSNFRYLHNFLRYYGVEEVDAILADLGVSSHHFDDSERGFSFRLPLPSSFLSVQSKNGRKETFTKVFRLPQQFPLPLFQPHLAFPGNGCKKTVGQKRW